MRMGRFFKSHQNEVEQCRRLSRQQIPVPKQPQKKTKETKDNSDCRVFGTAWNLNRRFESGNVFELIEIRVKGYR